MSILSRHFARGITYAWGAVSTPWRTEGFRILMYHAVNTPIPEDVLGIYTISDERLHAQMEFLSKWCGKKVTHFEQVANGVEGVAVTFDDGFKDNLTIAAPILTNLGIPFTVFVTSNHLSSASDIYLSVQELQELASYPGVTIGSHGASHKKLAECSDTELRNELVGSRAFLEDVLQKPVTTISYPHGSVDMRVERVAMEAGYKLGASSTFGTNKAHKSLLRLKRTDIWNSDSINDFERKLLGHWDWRGIIS